MTPKNSLRTWFETIPPNTASTVEADPGDVSINSVALEAVGAHRPAVAERRSSRDQQRFRETRPLVGCDEEEDMEARLNSKITRAPPS